MSHHRNYPNCSQFRCACMFSISAVIIREFNQYRRQEQASYFCCELKNIITPKQGGMISGVDLKPLSSDWDLYKISVTQIFLLDSSLDISSRLKYLIHQVQYNRCSQRYFSDVQQQYDDKLGFEAKLQNQKSGIQMNRRRFGLLL